MILRTWLNELDYELVRGSLDAEVTEVVYDSRKAVPGAVFVCMAGTRVDSHCFVPDVLRAGVRVLVTERDVEEELAASGLTEDEMGRVTILKTAEGRKSLALLSAARFGYPATGMITIGVTGTKGKTTTTHMIKAILEAAGKKVGMIGTTGTVINGQVTPTMNTTPESYELHRSFAKMAEAGCQYMIMEVSSQGIKMHRVDGLAFEGALVDDGQTFRVAVSADRLSAPNFPDCTPLWSAARDSRFAAQSGIPAAVLAGYLSEQTHLLGMLSPQRSSEWSLYTGSVNGPLNRLEFVTMLYEIAGKPKPGASAAFIDVSNSDAAVWAAETGVVSGNGTGKFLPTQTVTREQAAVMLYNYAKFLGLKTPSSGPSATALLDCGEIAVWARPAVEFCIRTGALPAAGLRGDLFLPRGTLTRGEANRCLAAFADYIEAN